MKEDIRNKTNEESNADDLFPVVGIGASAGGLQAVTGFLKALPEKSGKAFVFVQHLSPEHESALTEILQKITRIPVQQVTDNVLLEPDHFYIIPNNKILTAVDGKLKLDQRDVSNSQVKIIDVFFSSLGIVHQSYAVGIILSGTLNDGTLGLQVIKANGGITFAQDEGSAAYDDMPRNAINSGAVDFILSPEEIAVKLAEINYPFHTRYSKEEMRNNLPRQDGLIYKQILSVLYLRTGVDFAHYKQSTLRRRIARMMALNKILKPADYLSFLKENKNEQEALYENLLISVTDFFRDTDTFDRVCNTVIPSIINHKLPNEPIRIWCAGCATGEEVYSLAICLEEYLGDKISFTRIRLFATDISEKAIAKARSGLYRQSELAGVSALRLHKFFVRQNGYFLINKSIRDMCIFAHHNFIKDPPFSQIDLISCRNVLIYMDTPLQNKVLGAFHYSLNEKGFLLLGKSETVGINTDLFVSYDNHDKIYIKAGHSGRYMQTTTRRREQTIKDIDNDIRKEASGKDILKSANDILLNRYTPAGVLVNEQLDIIQFRGKTEKWLAPLPGRASLNLLRLIREELVFELRNLVNMVKKKNTPAGKTGLHFRINNVQEYVNIEVIPLPDKEESYFLILFQDAMVPGIVPVQEINAGDPSTSTQKQHKDPRDQRIEDLEKELVNARENIKATVEEQEAANEELQSANEELLSGSEELQSLNEELETSKEELQSTNEEINTINVELLARNEQLNIARKFSESIVDTIRDPLVILDKNLVVVRATKGFCNKFKINEQETEGKILNELGNGQWNIPELLNKLKAVLPEKKPFTDFEIVHIFPSLGHKVICLNANELQSPEGEQLILLSIEDVTDRRRVEEGLASVEKLFEENKERLRIAIESAGLGTWDFNPVTGELILDNRCKELFGLQPEDYMDYSLFLRCLHPDDRPVIEESVAKVLKGENNWEYDREYRVIGLNDQRLRWVKSKGKVYLNEKGIASRFVGTLLDITQQKLSEEAQQELLRNKDAFMAIACHELKTPVTSIKGYTEILQMTFEEEGNKKAVKMLSRMNGQVDKLTHLIEDLLDLTRLEEGEFQYLKTIFDFNAMVMEIVKEMQPTSTGLAINTKLDASANVYGDRDRLGQVVINLISNAIKYSPHTKEIVISSSLAPDTVTLCVQDFGIGIPKEKQRNVFDRFFRVSGIKEDTFPGLGLGLFISAEIIRRHNGTFNMESAEGKGSKFCFHLPLAKMVT